MDGKRPKLNLAQTLAYYSKLANGGTPGSCSVFRYYGKTYSKLQNPPKKRGSCKKKFHRQKK